MSLPTKSELYGNKNIQSVLPTKSELYGNNNNQNDFISLNIYRNNQSSIGNFNMNETDTNLTTNNNNYNAPKFDNDNNNKNNYENIRENPYPYSDNVRNNQNYIRFQNQQKPNENNYLVDNNIYNKDIMDNNKYKINEFEKNQQNIKNINIKENKIEEKEMGCFLRFLVCLGLIFCCPCYYISFVCEHDCQGGTERYCEQCRRICCCEKILIRQYLPGQ